MQSLETQLPVRCLYKQFSFSSVGINRFPVSMVCFGDFSNGYIVATSVIVVALSLKGNLKRLNNSS